MSSLTSTAGAVRGGGGGSSRSAFQEQEQNEAPTGGDAPEFAANAKAQPEDFATGTYTDPDLSVENLAVKNLAPRSSARWVAVQDGDWSSPSTWYDTTDEDQTVPDVADTTVLIPQGVTVTYDEAKASAVALKWVRVDGELVFDTTADRDWLHEYTYIDHTGTFTCGTEASPVPSTTTIRFRIDCDSDMDFANDMMKLGRGFVCFDGTVTIFGAEKVPFARIPDDPTLTPMATDTTITLDQAVTGWEVGDTVHVVGTRLRQYYWAGSDWAWTDNENEERTISSIDNSTPSRPVITLNSALTNDHLPSLYGYELEYDGEVTGFTEGATFNGGSITIIGVDDNGDGTGKLIFDDDPGTITDNATITDSAGGEALANGTVTNSKTCHVVNMTRNIQFEPILTDKSQYWRRPHNLWKGNGSVKVAWASAYYYGRTDHNRDETTNGTTYAIGDNKGSYVELAPWNGPDKMAARFLDYDAKTEAFYTESKTLDQAYNEKVTSSSGGVGRIADIDDNGDGTGRILLVDIEGTFADNDTLTSSATGSATQNGALSSVPTTAKTNFQGRYPFHSHRSGFEDPNTAAVEFTGLVVWDCPAWGYVHHDSHANIDRCVAGYSYSVGFAAEGGGNIGLWSDNFFLGQRPSEFGKPYNISVAKKGGNDFGVAGHGYWLMSRSVKLLRCISTNAQAGFAWTARAYSAQQTNVYPGAVSDSRIFWGLAEVPGTTVSVELSVIEQFKDCESYACYWGASVTKNQPNQHHDKRTLLENFKAWEVAKGLVTQYTGHYTQKDIEVHGIRPRGVPSRNGEAGISSQRQNVDMAVINGDFRGLAEGVTFTGEPGSLFDARKGHVIVEPKFRAVTSKYGSIPDTVETTPYSYMGTYDDVVYYTDGDVGTIGASFAYDEDQMVWNGAGHGNFCLIGTVTDSLGSHLRNFIRTEKAAGDYVTLQSEVEEAYFSTTDWGVLTMLRRTQMEALIQNEGVYTSDAGDKVLLIPDLIGDRFDGSNSLFYTPVALRISTSYFNSLNPADNGALPEEYEPFSPAGTPGLT